MFIYRFALVSFCLIFAKNIFAEQCTYTTSNGEWTYDFSAWKDALDDEHQRLYSDRFGVQNNTYFYRPPCSAVKPSFPAQCTGSSVCIATDYSTYVDGGAEAIWSDSDKPSQGVVITYVNGSRCGDDDALRKTTVILECIIGGDAPLDFYRRGVNPLSGQTFISHINDADECAVIMTVQTPFACPSNRPADPVCANLGKDECLTIEGCYCGFCDGKCVAYYEQCESKREFDCQFDENESEDHTFDSIDFEILDVLLLGFCFCVGILSCCLCCAACCRPSRYRNYPQDSESQVELQPSSGYIPPPYMLNPNFPVQPVAQAPMTEVPQHEYYWIYPNVNDTQ